MGKIVASDEASVSLKLATAKPKYITKPVLRYVETAQTLVKLKSVAEMSDPSEGKGLFVYGNEGADVYKITL